MRKQIVRSLLGLFLMIVLVGCSPAGKPGVEAGQATFTALNRDIQSRYAAKFEIQFQGSGLWLYQLNIRKADSQREETLHIEGVDKASNPGDIRLVTDGSTSRMSGPGTDNECMMFPNNQGMDPQYILPETLAPGAELVGKLSYIGDENLNGINTVHFQARGLALSSWQDASVDIWQAKDSLALVRFRFQADGDDPFFSGGPGTITARYDSTELGAEPILPVEGCEISVPLPGAAEKIIRLPGLASFETDAAGQEMTTFYQQLLGQEGWIEKEPPAQVDGAIVLSYTRAAEEIQVAIETRDGGGSKVKLIFLSAE